MVSAKEVLLNVSNSTKPASNVVPMEGVENLSIDVLIVACKKRGVVIEESVAEFLALEESDAAAAGYNPMRLKKDQLDVIMKLVNKKVPDRKAVDADGDSSEKVTVTVNLGRYPDPE